MKVDFDVLLSNFRDAKEGKTFKTKDVSDYVTRHILEPLQRDETPLYRNLDFSRFDFDDLAVLMDFLDDARRVSYSLSNLNRTFCQAEPVSVGCRSFC